MGWAGGESTAVDVHWQDPSPKPKSPVVQRVTPLSEAAEERLYTTARQVVRTRRGPPVDKTERTSGFGSSSPSRTPAGSRLHADDSPESVVGLAKKRDNPVTPPTQKHTTAVSVRKAPDSVLIPDAEPSKPPSPTNKASISRRNSKRKAKIDSTKKSDASDKALNGVQLLSEAERPTAAGVKAGAELLNIVDRARDVQQAEQAPNLDVDPGMQLEVGPEPEPGPGPELRPQPQPEPQLKPGQQSSDDLSGPGNSRVLATTVVREEADTSSKKQSEPLVQADNHPKRDDPILLPQSGEVEPDSDLEEPSSVLASSESRVADPVDENVRKAILGEAIAAATRDDVVLDEEDIVEAEMDDTKPRHVTTEHNAGEGLLATDNLSSDELLSRMENFLNFDCAVDSADNCTF
eukprot:COSAG02_NODE_4837_length_4923_cov_2.766169_2_plen_405_part_01